MPKRFSTQAQRDVFERIRGLLEELFGPVAQEVKDAPVLLVALGSAVAGITVHPWSDDDAVVTVRSHVVFGARVDEELCCFLLRENLRLHFGAFALAEEGDVVLQHDILGSTCQGAVLRNAVLAVLRTADDYDDKIKARWGGQRAMDVVR